MICVYIIGQHRASLDLIAQVLVSNGMELLELDEDSLLRKVNCAVGCGLRFDENSGSVLLDRTSHGLQESQAGNFIGGVGTKNLDVLADLLKTCPNRRLVLVTRSLVDAIAEGIDDYTVNFDCSQIVHEWQLVHQKLLHFFYRNSDRCVLVDSRDCLENDQDFLQHCKTTLGLPIVPQSDRVSISTKIDNPAAMYFAKRLLSRYPEAISLGHELAMSLAVSFESAATLSIFNETDAENALLANYREFEQERRNDDLVSQLRAELENFQEKLLLANIAQSNFEQHNEELMTDLHNAHQLAESSIEQKYELARQAKVLEGVVHDSEQVAENMKVQFEALLQKNLELEEKQLRVDSENTVLSKQFQQLLTNLDHYAQRNRVLEDSILSEQSVIKIKDDRLREVTDQYESLSGAHVQWIAERATLVEQIEVKNQVLLQQDAELKRLAEENQVQLSAFAEDFRQIQEKLVLELAAKQAVETEWLEISNHLDTIEIEHRQWIEERQALISQIEGKQSALTAFEREAQHVSNLHQLEFVTFKESLDKVQEHLRHEMLARQTAEAHLSDLSIHFQNMEIEHRQWLEERQTLIAEIEIKQSALTAFERDLQRISDLRQSELIAINESLDKVQERLAHETLARTTVETQLSNLSMHLDTMEIEHRQWLEERKNLIAQIEVKEGALTAFDMDSKRLMEVHRLELAAMVENTHQAQEALVSEVLAKRALDAHLLEYLTKIEALEAEQHRWHAERVSLFEKNHEAQSVFVDLKANYEALLFELHESQKDSEEQFSHGLVAAAALKNVEIERHTLESRLERFAQIYPISVEFERLEWLGFIAGKSLKMQWKLVGLEEPKRHVPLLLFSTIVEGDALGFCFSREHAANQLIRRANFMFDPTELMFSSVGDVETGPARVETWLALATSDFDMLTAMSMILKKELSNGSFGEHFGQSISSQLLIGLDAFDRFSFEMSFIFRYDRVSLKQATVNDDYEHLWLTFHNVRYQDVRSSHFELRLACSELTSKRFGSLPKLEFPRLDTQQPLKSWFVESLDNFGEKLELRFSLPSDFDVDVWGKLCLADRDFISSLLERLPTILRHLESDGVELRRPWSQWQSVVEQMSQCLDSGLISQVVVNTAPTERIASIGSDPLSLKTPKIVEPLNTNSSPIVAEIATAPPLVKRTPSAFLGFLQES